MSKKRGGFFDFFNGVFDVFDFSEGESYFRDGFYQDEPPNDYYYGREEDFKGMHQVPKKDYSSSGFVSNANVDIPIDVYIVGGEISSKQVGKFLPIIINNTSIDNYNVYINANANFSQKTPIKITKKNQSDCYLKLKEFYDDDNLSKNKLNLIDILLNLQKSLDDIKITDDMKREFKPKEKIYSYSSYKPKNEAKSVTSTPLPTSTSKSDNKEKPSLEKENVNTVTPNQCNTSEAKKTEEEFSTPFSLYLEAVNDVNKEKDVIKIPKDITLDNKKIEKQESDEKLPFLKAEEPFKKSVTDVNLDVGKSSSISKNIEKKVPQYQKETTYYKPKTTFSISTKNITIVSSNIDLFIDKNKLNQAQSIISDLKRKGINIIFYALNDENVVSLASLGFSKIEVLYDGF